MVVCKACLKGMTEVKGSCPRCGFRPPAVIGDPEAAQALIAQKAKKHISGFLRRLDLCVVTHVWKEQGEAVVADGQQLISFGTGDTLLEHTRFLKQKFSRVPDLSELAVELRVLKDGEIFLERTLSLPVPPGAYLLELGAELTSSLELNLVLKNPQGQTWNKENVIL